MNVLGALWPNLIQLAANPRLRSVSVVLAPLSAFAAAIYLSSFWWPVPAIIPAHVGVPIFAAGEGILIGGNPITGRTFHYLYPLTITDAAEACEHIPGDPIYLDTARACTVRAIGGPPDPPPYIQVTASR